MTYHIVVIGAGQASANTICEVRRLGHKETITVISDEPNLFYERPPLSKTILTSDAEIDSCSIIKPNALNDLNLNVIHSRAIGINRVTKTVNLSSGEVVNYDKLVIATGGTPNQPFYIESAERVFTLRTIEDAVAIKQALHKAKKIALIGGGWIGLELAASAKQMGLDVSVYERAQGLCTRHLNKQSSLFLENIHKNHGIELYFNCEQMALDAKETHVTVSSHGTEITYDFVIVGTGVTLNTSLAKDAGLTVQGGIVVDEKMMTSDEHIFAIGDVAINPTLGISLQTWANANESGKIAAYSLLNHPYTEAIDEPWFWSDQYDHHIQILGKFDPEDQQFMHETPDYTVFLRTTVTGEFKQLISFNFPKIIKLAKRWLRKSNQLDSKNIVLSTDWQELFK